MDAHELDALRHKGLVLDGREAAGVWVKGPDGKEVLVNGLPCINYVEGEYVLVPGNAFGQDILLQLAGIRHRALIAVQRDLDQANLNVTALQAKLDQVLIESAGSQKVLDAVISENGIQALRIRELVGDLAASRRPADLGATIRSAVASALSAALKRVEG